MTNAIERDPQGHQEAQTVPVRRFGQEGRLPGEHGCIKKWTMPIQNWKVVLNRFIIEFEDRLIDYV